MGHRILARDPEDEDEEAVDDPDEPDEWRDCSEHHDDGLDEARDAEGWPDF